MEPEIDLPTETDPAIVLEGDVRETLRRLPDASVHCCVTSPPYYGLRDYGCAGQIGLEPTPAEYVAQMVAVFEEVRRVLRPDGTLWLNLGDSYSGSANNGGSKGSLMGTQNATGAGLPAFAGKPKDLLGIPWRVAFALQDAGWYLRQDIIWAKPNPMPESVRDRCTKAHEYLFLLAKQPRYYFDAEAIAERSVDPESLNGRNPRNADKFASADPDGKARTRAGFTKLEGKVYDTRNRRSVWTVTPDPYPGAHFAVMPPELVRPCVLAGCPAGGVVLDPFAGSGTTLAVAVEERRRAVGCELNPEYAKLIRRRLAKTTPRLFAGADL